MPVRPRCCGDEGLDRLAPTRELVDRGVSEVAELQQPVHEQAQSALGRQSAGGGVRGVEQPGLLEVRHGVADGGGRQAERQPSRQGAAADRLAGFHVQLHHLPQDGGAAAEVLSIIAELRERRGQLRAIVELIDAANSGRGSRLPICVSIRALAVEPGEKGE